MDLKETPTDLRKPNIAALARLIAIHAPYDGIFDLRVPGVSVMRFSQTSGELTHAMQRSSACIVAQGAKSVMLGEDVHQYEASQVAVYSVDVPVAAQITRASHAEPYLNLKLDLDAQKVGELALKVYPHGLPQPRNSRVYSPQRHREHRVGRRRQFCSSEILLPPSSSVLSVSLW